LFILRLQLLHLHANRQSLPVIISMTDNSKYQAIEHFLENSGKMLAFTINEKGVIVFQNTFFKNTIQLNSKYFVDILPNSKKEAIKNLFSSEPNTKHILSLENTIISSGNISDPNFWEITVFYNEAQNSKLLLFTKEYCPVEAENSNLKNIVYQQVELGVVFQNTAGEITECNHYAEKLLGLKKDEIQGKTSLSDNWKAIDLEGKPLPGEKHPAMVALKTKTKVINFKQGIFNSYHNKYVWLNVTSMPLFDNKDKLIGVLSTFDDITEEVETKVSLNEAESKLQTIINEIDEVVFSYELPLKKLSYISENAKEFFGVKDLTFFEDYYWRYKMVHPNSIKTIDNLYQQIDESGWYNAEYKIVLPNKSEKWINTRGKVIKNVKGEPIRFDGLISDITDRKLAEIALKASEENYKFLVENIPDILFKFNLEGELLYISPSVEGILGYPPSFFQNKNFAEIVHPDDLAISAKHFESILKGGSNYSNQRYRIFHKNGQIRWHSSTSYLLKDEQGNPIGISGIATDITDIVNYENQLIENETRFRNLIENSHDIAFQFTLDGKLTYLSPAFEKILGYKIEDKLGGKFDPMVHPDDVPKLYSELEKRVQNREQLTYYEYRVLDSKGKYLWFSGNFSAKIENNKVVGFQGFTKYIHKKKIQELKEKELVKQITNQNEQLKNYAKIVSHNLRTHAQNISITTEMLKVNDPQLTERLHFQLLEKSTKSFSSTIEDLTEIAKLNLGEKLPFENICIENKVKKVISIVGNLAEAKGVKIMFDDSKEHYIKGIRVYLESVITNLITNAIKYADAEKENSFVKIEIWEDSETIFIAFKDNGLGIDLEKNKSKIFSLYKTFHGNKDARGIGLFITKNQVEAMGGSILVESTPKIGSTFTLAFKKEK
jgi:PAS domain S-box-containing protein